MLQQEMSKIDQLDDSRRDARNKLDERVNYAMNASFLQSLSSEEKQDFIVRLQSYKSWQNGQTKEYLAALASLNDKISHYVSFYSKILSQSDKWFKIFQGKMFH